MKKIIVDCDWSIASSDGQAQHRPRGITKRGSFHRILLIRQTMLGTCWESNVLDNRCGSFSRIMLLVSPQEGLRMTTLRRIWIQSLRVWHGSQDGHMTLKKNEASDIEDRIILSIASKWVGCSGYNPFQGHDSFTTTGGTMPVVARHDLDQTKGHRYVVR